MRSFKESFESKASFRLLLIDSDFLNFWRRSENFCFIESTLAKQADKKYERSYRDLGSILTPPEVFTFTDDEFFAHGI